MLAAPLRFRHLLWLLAGVVVVYAIYGFWVVGLRVQYPYDHLIWSESPFLTNMLKLHNGVELFGPAADANSFVYTPGLEYLCFTVLSPFGLHLSLVACKMVNVAVGGLAALAAGRLMFAMRDEGASSEPTDAIDRAVMGIFLVSVSALILLKNFTFDVCHPDNLHALHMAGGLLLAHRALRRGDFKSSMVVAALLGFGLLLKQTCALGGIGVALYLALDGRARWGWRKASAVVLVAGLTTGIGAWWLLVHQDHGRFWLLDVLALHPIQIWKLDHLWLNDLVMYRGVLYLGAAVLAVRGLFSEDDRLRRLTGLWLFAGATGVAPALLAYTKQLGLFNNLIVVDLWAALMVVPCLINLSQSLLSRSDKSLGIAAATALTLCALGLYPTKRPPLPAHWEYGRALEMQLARDVAEGRRVVVAHGTAAWIRAGFRGVPLDRSNSILELGIAAESPRAGTAERFASGYYDRVYTSWPQYDEDMKAALTQRYEPVAVIPPVAPLAAHPSIGSTPHFASQMTIYERR